jgi:hypothetical protein
MKRIMTLLLCVLLVVSVLGCSEAKGIYSVFPMKQTASAVNQQIIDNFLTNNENYSNYEEIQKNVPDILSYLVNITPDTLKEICSIYRFSYEPGTSLSGETFLIYENRVYPLGCAVGGYGITEFAYTSNNGNNTLYFIYSWGSGIHRSHIGAFNFNTKEITDHGELAFRDQDIAFYLSEDGNTLGICQAQIRWENWDVLAVAIEKGECLYQDINTLIFSAADVEE